MIIGIDIGGSTTKIIGIDKDIANTPLLVKATDPIASLFGAFGKFIDSNSLSINDVERVMITGVGASFVNKPIYGIPTGKVAEFLSNGRGGLYLSGLLEALIVSMGTGTSLVKACGKTTEHIGGTGIGGGTILGLSGRMLNIRDIDLIIKTAEKGNLKNVDLQVGDIIKHELPSLSPNITASNFGKISDIAAPQDIALGILNLVFQSIGMTAVFALSYAERKDVVLIGNLSTIPICKVIFQELKEMFNVNFMIPEHSEYATALGAALAYSNNDEYLEIV